MLLEGPRLVADALEHGLELELLLVATDKPELVAAFAVQARGRLVEIEPELLDRISDLKTSPGILALAWTPAVRPVDELGAAMAERGASAPLVLVVDGVSDPVNLGALARSAEAAGAAGLVFVRGGASPWNPRALRGSMGSLLRLALFEAEDAEAAQRGVAEAGLRIVRPDTRGGVDWRAVDWAPPTALWIGGETHSAGVEGLAVSIPMGGAVESLNVTVAASLLLFAAGRGPSGGAS